MLWNDTLDARYQPVVGSDHPLSLGYVIKLVSTSPYSSRAIRVRKAEIRRILEEQHSSEGLTATWTARRLVVVVINMSATGPWARKRVIELLVHEASHIVDGFFERAAFERVDTELRAYHVDWIVGKCLLHFPSIAN